MTIALLLLFVLILALLALGYWVSSLLLYPPRQPLRRTPAERGLTYEEVNFQSPDGLTLKGWWIPAMDEAPAPAVILLHPMFGNRHGYEPHSRVWAYRLQTRVDLLDLACRFHKAGFVALLFDFRNHGESQRGLCAGGFNEDQDVTGAVDYVFNRLTSIKTNMDPQVGLVGFGLGACAAIAAIGREKGGNEAIRVFSGDSESATGWTEFTPANVKKLCFLAAIEPVSLSELLRGELLKVIPLLDRLIARLVDRLCQWRGGYPLDGVLLLKLVRHVNVPVLYVQPGPDEGGNRTGVKEVRRLFDATTGPKHIWWIDSALSPIEASGYVCTNPEHILEFARSNVNKA